MLGLIIGIALLVAGETTMEVDLTLEFGPFDSIWWILGVPSVALLVLVVVSPLSFLVHRQLSRNRPKDRAGGN